MSIALLVGSWTDKRFIRDRMSSDEPPPCELEPDDGFRYHRIWLQLPPQTPLTGSLRLVARFTLDTATCEHCFDLTLIINDMLQGGSPLTPSMTKVTCPWVALCVVLRLAEPETKTNICCINTATLCYCCRWYIWKCQSVENTDLSGLRRLTTKWVKISHWNFAVLFAEEKALNMVFPNQE